MLGGTTAVLLYNRALVSGCSPPEGGGGGHLKGYRRPLLREDRTPRRDRRGGNFVIQVSRNFRKLTAVTP